MPVRADLPFLAFLAGLAGVAALLGGLAAHGAIHPLLVLAAIAALAGLVLGARGVARARGGLENAVAVLGLAPSLALVGYLAYLFVDAVVNG